jgi:hypothetical protein
MLVVAYPVTGGPYIITISATVPHASTPQVGDNDEIRGNINNEILKLPTIVNFSGVTYPLSKVYILKDGKNIFTTVSNKNGDFSVSIFGLNTNTYTFYIYGEDYDNIKSPFFSLPIFITEGTTVNISNIDLLLPILDTDKSEVKKEKNLIKPKEESGSKSQFKSSGDVNSDDYINLIDFSILVHWYKKSNPPKEIDLNHDDRINLVDFSILAYNWTD